MPFAELPEFYIWPPCWLQLYMLVLHLISIVYNMDLTSRALPNHKPHGAQVGWYYLFWKELPHGARTLAPHIDMWSFLLGRNNELNEDRALSLSESEWIKVSAGNVFVTVSGLRNCQ